LTPSSAVTISRGLTAGPVYFAVRDGHLWWSTRPHDLARPGPAMEAVRPGTLAALIGNANLGPSDTHLRGVQRLEPGAELTVEDGGVTTRRQDEFRVDDTRGLPLAAASAELRQGLREGIVDRCGAAGRVAISLSGGIDSGAVLVEAADLGLDVVGLHYTAPEMSAVLDLDRKGAEAAAGTLGIPLSVVDIRDTLEPQGGYLQPDVPLSGPYAQGLLRFNLALAERCRDFGCSVLLTGYLSDQLLGVSVADLVPNDHLGPVGPPARFLRVLWALYRLRRSVLGWHLGLDGHTSPPLEGSVLDEEPAAKVLGSAGFLRPAARDEALEACRAGFRARCARAAAALGPLSSPTRVATFAAVADGLERPGLEVLHRDVYARRDVRLEHPFCSRALIEFALSLPDGCRTRRLNGQLIDKVALRYAYVGRLPRDNVRRQLWLQMPVLHQRVLQQNDGRVRELLGSHSRLAQLGVIEPSVVTRTLEDPRLRAQQAGFLVAACLVECWLAQLDDARTRPVPR
jgi:asparagine synthetase B (glutamine-hydrolysing)